MKRLIVAISITAVLASGTVVACVLLEDLLYKNKVKKCLMSSRKGGDRSK